MSTRSNWSEFDKETRKYIKKRDGEKCIICHSKGALQIMHIFLSRAKGGKGCKENGCLGCVKCHKIIDNPIGQIQNETSKRYLKYCKEYLIQKENILENYGSETNLINNLLKFKNKPIELKSFDLNSINILEKKKQCRKCIYCIKKSNKYNSLPTYYCRLKHKRVNKNNICENYKEI